LDRGEKGKEKSGAKVGRGRNPRIQLREKGVGLGEEKGKYGKDDQEEKKERRESGFS